MRVWKLVSGILSIILFAVVMFQSCAAGVVNALEDNGGISGSVGVIVGILMLAGGIVSIATRNKTGKGHDIAMNIRQRTESMNSEEYICHIIVMMRRLSVFMMHMAVQRQPKRKRRKYIQQKNTGKYTRQFMVM